ncbi:MAG TPA: hypothetical protein VFS08_05145 [Gemmatimonadaceae bacterium]|nr:hypothetical protein [Gemmatimonadaceae bacterium]
MPALLGVAMAAAAACTDVPSSPDEPFSIGFERLPFPAVVAGDLLRDSTGEIAPLGAVAFNTDQEPIEGFPVEYVFIGDAAGLEPGDRVRGVVENDTVRITAFANGIPSLPQTLWVVPRPDSLVNGAQPADITYGLPASAADTSGRIADTLLATTGQTAPAPVRAWIVRYRIVVDGDTLDPNDQTLAFIVDDAGRPSPLDTTDAAGAVARKVRVNAFAGEALAAIESLVVSVTVEGVTTPPRGAPRQVTIPVRPRPPAP